MAYQDRFYTIGAATVQSGSAVVNGTGTGWETALIDGGVIFVGGGSYPIYSVESETSLTLAYPFTDASGADLPYAIDRQRAAATSNIQMNDRLAQIIREISVGNIEEFNALTLQPDKSLSTDSQGKLQLSNLGTLGRVLLALAAGNNTQYVQGDGTLQAKAGLPVSTATQTALNTKFDKSGGTISGGTSVNGFFTVNNMASFNGDGNWSVLDIRARGAASGEACLDFTPRGYIEDFTWRMQTANARWDFDIIYGGGDGYPTGTKFRINREGTGRFFKDLIVDGYLSKASGTFLIDHPLPDLLKTKNLRHGFVESTEYLNIYRGVIRLENGRAVVNIDEFFGMTEGTFFALNADITVSALQNQESFDRLRPAAVLNSATFEIVCENDSSTDLVSWMVTGRRKDPFVVHLDPNCERGTGRFIPEFDKPVFQEPNDA